MDDEKEGNGKMTFASGAVYCGTFSQGLKNGHGDYLFADGARYIGDFKHEKRTGKIIASMN